MDKKSAFMGEVTAGITHEMKNVLAIIKESVGLMQDLLSLNEDKILLNKPKLDKSLTRMYDQVQRGVDLVSSLNSFAHYADDDFIETDLNTLAKQAAFNGKRSARLKGIVLKPESTGDVLFTNADPMIFQMLVYECVKELFTTELTSNEVVFRPHASHHINGLSIEFSIKDDSNVQISEGLRTKAENLGFGITINQSDIFVYPINK